MGKRPYFCMTAVLRIMNQPNIACRPFHRSALTDGPKPYLASHGKSAW